MGSGTNTNNQLHLNQAAWSNTLKISNQMRTPPLERAVTGEVTVRPYIADTAQISKASPPPVNLQKLVFNQIDVPEDKFAPGIKLMVDLPFAMEELCRKDPDLQSAQLPKLCVKEQEHNRMLNPGELVNVG